MVEPYDIQSGVPVPKVRNNVPRKFRLDTMRVGDSLMVPRRSAKALSAYISRVTKDMPARFVVRSVSMRQPVAGEPARPAWIYVEPGTPGSIEGAGVWRVE